MKAFVIALFVLIPSGQAQNNPTSANNKACCKAYSTAKKLPITAILTANEGENWTYDQQQTEATKETRILGLSRDGFAQVLVSFILAIITGIYAFLTWRMLHKVGAQVEIMQKQVSNAGEQLIASMVSNNAMFQQIGHMQKANEQTGRLIEEARISADAAKASADALVNSERAWLMIDVEPFQSERVPIFTSADDTTAMLDVIATNAGRSPAWIIQHFQRFQILETIPAVPDFEKDKTGDIYSIPVAPRWSIYRSKRCELTAEGHRTDYDRKQAIVHGLIRYRDIFGKDRWTTYGFYVSRTGRLERMADFPEYNKGT